MQVYNYLVTQSTCMHDLLFPCFDICTFFFVQVLHASEGPHLPRSCLNLIRGTIALASSVSPLKIDLLDAGCTRGGFFSWFSKHAVKEDTFLIALERCCVKVLVFNTRILDRKNRQPHLMSFSKPQMLASAVWLMLTEWSCFVVWLGPHRHVTSHQVRRAWWPRVPLSYSWGDGEGHPVRKVPWVHGSTWPFMWASHFLSQKSDRVWPSTSAGSPPTCEQRPSLMQSFCCSIKTHIGKFPFVLHLHLAWWQCGLFVCVSRRWRCWVHLVSCPTSSSYPPPEWTDCRWPGK